jgi:3-oxoacyl-[acyl-carrier-protein] synthase II
MQERRVVITGYGSISALGEDFNGSLVNALMSEQLEHKGGHTANLGVADIHGERFLDENQIRRTDRFSQMAVVATQIALQSSGLSITESSRERVGVMLNTSYGPLATTEAYVSKLLREGARKAPAMLFPYTVQNAFTGLVTTHIKALGTNSTLSGANPVACGFDAIRQGTDDVMVAGGCEELTPSLVKGLTGQGQGHSRMPSDPGATREVPMQSYSSGLSEGAAVVILEEEEHALVRGASPIARVLDYGLQSISTRSEAGLEALSRVIARTVRQSVERSGFGDKDVHLIVVSAAADSQLREWEREAYSSIPNCKDAVAINPALRLGNTLGASGVFGLIAALGCMAKCDVPLTIRVGSPGLTGSTRVPLTRAIVLDLQIGGNVTALAIEKY